MYPTCLTDTKGTNILFDTSIFETHEVKELKTGSSVSTESIPHIVKIINVGSINVNETKKNLCIDYKREDPIYNHIVNLIFKGMAFPNDWRLKGINPPNIDAKKTAEKVCFNLYDFYSLIPIKITPTKEEGIFIYYKNFNNNRVLLIEVYNNLEIAALVNDETTRNIIYSEDIKALDFINIIENLIEK